MPTFPGKWSTGSWGGEGVRRRRRFSSWCRLVFGAGAWLCLVVLPRVTGGEGHGYPWLRLTDNEVFLRPVGEAREERVEGPQRLRIGDRVRTGENSRAIVEFGEREVERLGELSELLVVEEEEPERTGAVAGLLRGVMFLFARDEPDEVRFRTPHVFGASRGTDFIVRVSERGTEVSVLAGAAWVVNGLSGLGVEAKGGEVAEVRVGVLGPPVLRPVVQATAGIQWFLYYAAVLDPLELGAADRRPAELGWSMEAYRRGDLSGALERLPAGFEPSDDAERVYLAAMLLSAGQVEKCEELLDEVTSPGPGVYALRWLLGAVLGLEVSGIPSPGTTSEWLGYSYYLQSRRRQDAETFDLREAEAAAEQAVGLSRGESGFAHVRLAELLFSQGKALVAERHIERALEQAPDHAEAWALRGFMLSGQNRLNEALHCFLRARELNSHLGDAWLGGALVKIRTGDGVARDEALKELLLAAALEPQRSLFRSYLGKAFADASDELRRSAGERRFLAAEASKELGVARELDPADPTPWLYGALVDFKGQRFNAAIGGVRESLERNDHRAVYRSELLLDQDRAVRSYSLAKLYRAAGLIELSIREATRSVDADYANSSAHLFLAESWNERRDPTRFNLRYETAWFNELLLANLLSPVGAGTLSQHVSQQEYSRLFERQRLGLNLMASVDEHRDMRLLATQYGLFEMGSYALDVDVQDKEGNRPNNDLQRLEWYTQIKQQVSARDSLFLLTKYQDFESGDNYQHYDPADASVDLRVREIQDPLLLLAYHREWSPGIHTVLMGARLTYDQEVKRGPAAERYVLSLPVTAPFLFSTNLNGLEYAGEFEAFSFEWNQIIQRPVFTWVLGSRVQGGDFSTTSRHELLPGTNPGSFEAGSLTRKFAEPFQRLNVYGYQYTEPLDGLIFTAGLAYDWMEYPLNYRFPPVAPGTEHTSAWSPKAAVRWSPISRVAVRGIYSKALGGVTLDESFRLEPTQLAGFNQAFRTIISESEVGSIAAPRYEISGVGLDWDPGRRWYFGVEASLLGAEVDQRIGVFEQVFAPPAPPSALFAATQREMLDYDELSIGFDLSKLVGEWWSLGIRYRYLDSELDRRYPGLEGNSFTNPNRQERARLHHPGGFVDFHHSSGVFSRLDLEVYHQINGGYWSLDGWPERPGDSFAQLHWVLGYRFFQQRGEFRLGWLNLTDQDYRLNPLNLTRELPRERTFFSQMRLNF